MKVKGYRCNKCHKPMKGSTAYDGACACGGLIETIWDDAPVRIPIPKPGGPMKDRKKYNRKRKHKRKWTNES
jgi:hypothetical protein